jgi:hypothetical protein
VSKLGGDGLFDNYYPGEDELIQGAYDLAAQGAAGSTVGKTPANKFNFIQDIASAAGISVGELLGLAPDYGPAPTMADNPVDRIYGRNPVFGSAFDLIDTQGFDPVQAYERALEANPTYLGNKDSDLDILNQYAFTQLKNNEEFKKQQAEYEQKTAGGGAQGWTTAKDLWAKQGVPVDNYRLATAALQKDVPRPSMPGVGVMKLSTDGATSRAASASRAKNDPSVIAKNRQDELANAAVKRKLNEGGNVRVRTRDNANLMATLTMLLPLLNTGN